MSLSPMCGRYTILFKWKELHRLMRLSTPPAEWPVRFNVAPTQVAPVVRADDAGPRSLSMLRWGLVPFWAKDLKIGASMINARAEGIEVKPAFRAALKKRRCIVPVSGFYEWMKLADGKSKQPHYITSSDGEPIAFAGLWERWAPPEDRDGVGAGGGAAVETFTIITTTPNRMMASLHDRMPVVLSQSDFDRWLDPQNQDAAGLLPLLAPCADDTLIHFPVSTLVNSPRNDDPACIQPLVLP